MQIKMEPRDIVAHGKIGLPNVFCKLIGPLPCTFFHPTTMDEVSSEKQYAAPDGYDTGKIHGQECYAFIVTVNSFESEKIKRISSVTTKDHDSIHAHLVHNFIGQLSSHHVISIKDPTCDEFMNAFEKFRMICKRTGTIFVYISTHVMTVTKGRNASITAKKENAYFCMKDTAWVTPEEAANTSISLTSFCDNLEYTGCNRKTVFVNYAHLPKPERSAFKTRLLYPPPDFLTRLVTMGNCVAIGSCNIGTPVSEIVKYSYKPAHLRNKVRTSVVADSGLIGFESNTRRLSFSSLRHYGVTNLLENLNSSARLLQSNATDDFSLPSHSFSLQKRERDSLDISMGASIHSEFGNRRGGHHPLINSMRSAVKLPTKKEFEKELTQKIYEDWGLRLEDYQPDEGGRAVPSFVDALQRPSPPLPQIVREKNIVEYHVTIPSDQQVYRFSSSSGRVSDSMTIHG